jgi:hypothetical protein
MSKDLIIIGGGSGRGILVAADLAQIKAHFPNTHIVTIEEAKEKDLVKTFENKERSQIPIEPLALKTNFYAFEKGGMSKRAVRRKAERDAKKGKKKW